MQKKLVLKRGANAPLTCFCLAVALVACQASTETLLPDNRATLSQTLPKDQSPWQAAGSIPIPATVRHGIVPGSASSRHRGSGFLSMEDAVRQAIAFHPSIPEATSRIRESDARIRMAQAGYYPSIKAGLDTRYKSRNRDGWRPNFNISASQMLYDFGKVSSSVDTERAGKDINTARLEVTSAELARDTANAIVEVQRFARLAKLANDQAASIKSIAGLILHRTDEGLSTMSDTVQANARVESAIAKQWQYQAELTRWQNALESLTGNSARSPDPAVPGWLAKACEITSPNWNSNPAMMRAEAEKLKAAALLSASASEAYPTISLEASTGYDIPIGQGHGSARDHGRDVNYTIGLNVTSSLYNGGLTGAKKEAGLHALESAEASARLARHDIERHLIEARGQIGTLSRLIQALESRLVMSEKTRDLYQTQYLDLGTRTLLDLLNAEQELHESRFEITNSRHDIRLLHIRCLFNSGEIRKAFGLSTGQSEQAGSTH